MEEDSDNELSPKEISQRLDFLLAQLLDKSLQLREGLAQPLKNGHFNISKAKYSMGPLAVSQYKYPNTIKPSILVSVSNTNKPDSTFTLLNTTKTGAIPITNKINHRTTNYNKKNNQQEEEEEDNNNIDDASSAENQTTLQSSSSYESDDNPIYDNAPILIRNSSKDSPSSVTASSLRRRRADSGNSKSGSRTTNSPSGRSLTQRKKEKDEDIRRDDDWTERKAEKAKSVSTGGVGKSAEREKIERMLASVRLGGNGVGAESDEEEEEEEMKIKNPLNWFGVLVPQQLRQAQTDFGKVMEQIVELANVVHQMELYQKEYFVLLDKKNAS